MSVVVALLATRTRALSTSGALAAVFVGSLCVAAGWSWGALLLSLFLSSSALSRVGERKKEARLSGVVQKSGERDAAQVLANGGLFAAAALAQLLFPSAAWAALGAGAVAASTADTWATEIGTLSASDPISVLSGDRVPAGTSGAVTLVGTVAGVGGALFIGAGATLARWPVSLAAIVLGGVGGAFADSMLGATLQARRWCDVCASSTERLVHTCGNATRHLAGLRRFDNDVVNAICSAVGGLIALVVSRAA